MPNYLIVYMQPDGGESRFELAVNESYRIGSKPDNDIVIPQKDVSRHHALLRVHDGWFHITDLKSKNGTFVNGNQTTAAEFRPGDLVALSSARLLLVEDGSQGSTGGTGAGRESHAADPGDSGVRDETGQVRIHVGVDDLVQLLDVTAAAVENRALADPLAWAVGNLDLAAAIVIYRDADGRVAVVSSAGDLGPLVGSHRTLVEIAGAALREARGTPRIRHVFEVREDLLVASAHGDHVIVLRYSGSPPAVTDVQAVVSSVNAVLAAGRNTAGGLVADPSGDPDSVFGGIHGCSETIAEVRRQAAALGSQRQATRLLGEAGVGRQRFARFMHSASDVRSGRMIVVDISAIRPQDLETELFGDGDLAGRLSLAAGGTLLISGVELIPGQLQERLATAIRESWDTDTPVLFLSSAERFEDEPPPRLEPLERLLGCVTVEIPALRQRRSDIPLIASAVLSREVQRGGLPAATISPEAATLLTEYHWPGNVAELRDELIRAAVSSGGGALEPHHFSVSIQHRTDPPRPGPAPKLDSFRGLPLNEARERFEHWLITETLAESDGNQSLAARRLGMSRAGLFKKIKRLGVED